MRINPIFIGISGHKSLTSKTKIEPFIHLANTPGIPAVKGVDVAKTKSKSEHSATSVAKKLYIRKISKTLFFALLYTLHMWKMKIFLN